MHGVSVLSTRSMRALSQRYLSIFPLCKPGEYLRVLRRVIGATERERKRRLDTHCMYASARKPLIVHGIYIHLRVIRRYCILRKYDYKQTRTRPCARDDFFLSRPLLPILLLP